MSISDAINNAKQKINNVYNALEAKGASMPEVRNLEHMVTTVQGLTEFYNTYKDWEYNGAAGYLNLTNYIGSSNTVKAPYTNYTRLTNTALSNKPNITYIDCNNTPFTDAVSAFQADYDLQYVGNINVPDGTTTVQSMFYDCRGLKSAYVNLPSSVTTGTQMFLNCKGCTEVVLNAPGLTTLTNTFALVGTTSSSSYNITITSPNVTGTTNFWRSYNASDMKNIFIYYRYSNGDYTPTFNAFNGALYMGSSGNSTTTYIQPRDNTSSMFFIWDITYTGGISNLPNFKVYNDGTVRYIGLGKSSNEPINIPEILSYRKFPDTSEVQNVVVTNMAWTFLDCYNLNQNIQIPNSVTDMYRTFSHCINLNQNIQIPNSVTNMERTFYNCTNLNQNIQIPNSVTNMVYTFDNCYNLNQNIQIPNSVTSMYSTFQFCNNLQGTINILSNQITSASGCFYGTSLPKNVYIPFKYSNGVNSATFNSFVRAGYLYANGTSKTQHGVTIQDLNQYY